MRNAKERTLKSVTVQLIDSAGAPSEGRFTCTDISAPPPHRDSAKLILEHGGKPLEASAGDFFAALQLIRLQLEPLGLTPRVNGACVDVYPSGMARDMGFGFSAYRLFPGEPWGDLDDLVDIFAADAINRLGTVAEQESCFREWLKVIAGD